MRIAMRSRDASKAKICGNYENLLALAKIVELAWFCDKFSNRKILEGLIKKHNINKTVGYNDKLAYITFINKNE